MTIKTLELIHSLLIEEEANRIAAAEASQDVWRKAAAAEAQNAEKLYQESRLMWDRADDASSALRDFENHEFH